MSGLVQQPEFGDGVEGLPEPFLTAALEALPWLVPIHGIVFWRLGLYRGVWRFASVPDLARILKAVFVGLAVSMAVIFAVTRLMSVSPL